MKKIIYHIILITLMALWIPISLDKFINYELFKSAMIQQPFADQLGIVLSYTLPPVELAAGLLFISPRMRLSAFKLSSLLMLAFVTYVGLAVLNVWGKIPCGCGLIFNQLSWTAHLWLNTGFLVISLFGLWLELDLSKAQYSDNHIKNNSADTAIADGQLNEATKVPVDLKTSHRLHKE